MTLDFNDAAPQETKPTTAPTWAREGPSSSEVKASLLRDLEGVLGTLYPNGFADPKGNQFYIGNTMGSAGESMAVELRGERSGLWFDFATGEGGDILDLWREARGTGDFNATLKDAGEYTGAYREIPRQRPRRKPSSKTSQGVPVATYRYCDFHGNAIAEVERFETIIDGKVKKNFRPWSVKDRAFKAPDPRPLYNLENLASAPEIILVEGEKCADALIGCNIDATTAMNGSNAPVEKTDWEPLRGRKVVIWPDNDETGKKYAQAAAQALQGIASHVEILHPPEGKPDKWDAADAIENGDDPRKLIADMRRAGTEEPTEPLLFRKASDLHGVPVPKREWLIEDMIPMHTVTMLGGDGGTGKSLLALQLAAAVATNTIWAGKDVDAPGRALFVSAEDDDDEIHRRLTGIAKMFGKGMTSLDRLHTRSLAGEDALLATLDRKNNALAQTRLYAALDAALHASEPSLLVLDTLADLHSGEENSRTHARQFIGMLRSLAIRHKCAVVLLAHPSLTGMSTGSGLSGSTAWNGSVRSRLYFERVIIEGEEPDTEARKLSVKKSNYGPVGNEIMMRWEDGIFVPKAIENRLDQMAAQSRVERVFLAVLHRFEAEGRHVNHAGGPNYAPTIFAEQPDAEGLTKRALKSAMNSLFAAGRLQAVPYGPPSRKATKIVEVKKNV